MNCGILLGRVNAKYGTVLAKSGYVFQSGTSGSYNTVTLTASGTNSASLPASTASTQLPASSKKLMSSSLRKAISGTEFGNGDGSESVKTDVEIDSNLAENVENTLETKEEVVQEQTLKVVQINETTYSTISEALLAANSGDTIKLLEDISLTEEVTIEKGKNIIIDLNGKTITSTSSNTINNKGTLTISSTGIIRNEVQNGTVIYNTGTVNMNNGVITTAENGGKAIYNDSGTLNISGGKVVTEGIGAIGIYNVNNGQIKATGGIIENTGDGSKGIYNNASLDASDIKIIVSSDDSIGIYNGSLSKECSLDEITITLEKENIENYELIKNTNEFKDIDKILMNTDLVIWDDITANRLLPSDQVILNNYISKRIQNGKSNIFNGMFRENLAEYIGEDLANRFNRFHKILLKGVPGQ